jgi:hypothetical protein
MNKREVLGRTNRLIFFDTPLTAQKTTPQRKATHYLGNQTSTFQLVTISIEPASYIVTSFIDGRRGPYAWNGSKDIVVPIRNFCVADGVSAGH